jgi:hypothetical protein
VEEEERRAAQARHRRAVLKAMAFLSLLAVDN